MDIRWATLFLDIREADFDAGQRFWCTITGSRLSARRGADGEFATLLPADGDPYLRVQRVRTGSGGVHLDLHLDTRADAGALTRAAAEAEGCGASVRTSDADLVLLDSPGGFTFCLVPWDGETAIPAPGGPAGPASRVDQLCLDIPAEAWETERAFWAALTGWPQLPSDPGDEIEFTPLRRPGHLPVRILLQRRDSSAPGDRVTGHLDVGVGDQADALAAEHVALGARLVSEFDGWVLMADPGGRTYCLTRRPPHG